MSVRAFFDTNVLVYAFDVERSIKTVTATRLLSEAAVLRAGVLSHQVVHEFFNVAFRRFRPLMTAAEARAVMRHLERVFDIVPPSRGCIDRAIDIHDRLKFQWYDCLIVAAALESRCTVLYTEDLQHGQRMDDLTVVNPFRP